MCRQIQKNTSADDLENAADKKPRLIGVAASVEFKESAYFIHNEWEELQRSDQKCFNHKALYFGYNVTNAFCCATKSPTT